MQTSAPGRKMASQLTLGMGETPLRRSGWPEDPRALTLTAPWGWLMTQVAPPDRKLVENRTWPPIPSVLQGEWFMLHQGVSYDADAMRWIARQLGHRPPSRAELVQAGQLGALLAFARVVRVTEKFEEVPVAQRRWRMLENRYGWLLDVHPLKKPVPCLGWHKLWRVSPPRVSSALVKSLGATFGQMGLADLPLAEVA